MSDKIFIKQNDESILELLFAQDRAYSLANKYNRIGWFTMIIMLLWEMYCIYHTFSNSTSIFISAVFSVLMIYNNIKNIKYGSNIKH